MTPPADSTPHPAEIAGALPPTERTPLMAETTPALPPEIAAKLDEYATHLMNFAAAVVAGAPVAEREADEKCTVARAALEAAIGELVQDAAAFVDEAEMHAQALDELAEAQRALVLLANQLETHSVPFVPAAEAATAKARREVEQDSRLLAAGMNAAAAVFAAKRAARTPTGGTPT